MASRLDFSQIRSLYIGTSSSTTVDTNNLIVVGSVGIGTTAPGSKLQVEGANPFIRVNNTSADDHGIKISYNGSDAHGLHLLYNANSAVSYIDNTYQAVSGQVYGNIYIRQNVGGTMTSRITIKADGGNVGIGNTSPNGALSFADDVNTRKIVLWDGAANNNYQFYGLGVESSTFINSIYDTADRFLWVAGSGSTSRSEVMVLTGTGRLGIGTTSPASKLQVSGTGVGAPLVTITETSAAADQYSQLELAAGNRRGYIWLGNENTSSWAGAGGLNIYTANGNMDLWTGATQRVRITNGGNVLINTTTDAGYKLDVNGTFRSQGTAYFGGNVNFSNQYRTYGLPYFEMGGGGITDEYLLLVPKYVSGTVDPYLLMGELQFQRGSTSTGNDNSVTTINIQTAYNQTNFYQFSINGATVWTSIDIISVSGVQWYALKARTSGGGPYLVNQFVGNLTDSGSQMLTRVRLSDAGVSLVTANVFLPSYTNYGNYIVRGTSFDSPYFALQGDQYTLVEMADRTSGATDVGFIGIYNENTKVIDIPGNSDKVYFNNGGNFLIGTTTDNGAKLNVNGTSYINGAASFGSTIDVNGNVTLTQDTNDLIFQQTNSSSHGIVWKNTSYTKDSASIRPTGNGAWATQGIGFYTGNAGNSTTAPSLRFNIQAGGDSIFYNNVGIGTTSPGNKLAILAPDTAGVPTLGTNQGHFGIFNGTGAGSYGLLGGIINNGNAYLQVQRIDGTATAYNMLLQPSGGNVGINQTSPIMKLHIADVGANIVGGNAISTSTMKGVMIQNTNNGDESVGVWFNTGGNHWSGISGQRTSAATNWATDLRFYTHEAATVDLTYARERVRIDSEGNVGIGTTSPAALLNVGATGTLHFTESGIGSMLLKGASGTARGMLEVHNGNSSSKVLLQAYTGGAGVGTLSNTTLDIVTNSTTRMVVTSGGNVGIGTTSPSYNLDVSGSARVNSTSNLAMFVKTNSAFGAAISYEDSTTGGNDVVHAGAIGSNFYIATGYSERVRVTSGGNVGIGTTSPTEKLHVNGNAVLTYNNSYQGINSVGNKAILARVSPTTGIINYAEYATAANLNGFVMGSDDARVKGNIATDSLEFITNGSTQVTVLSNGNVGIANTNPSEKLSVTGNIRMDNGAADGPQLVLGSSGFSDWNIDNFSGSLRAYYGSTEYTRLTSSGNFGIGVSPSYKLDVAGDTRITSGSLGVGVVPNATDGRIDASNDIVAYSSSDRRLKENITPIANALDKVKSLTGVEFDWKPEHKKAHGYEGHDTGVIAQEVQEVMPTAVRTNDTGYLAVRYEKMIGLLIEAMKEQQTQIDELKAKLDGLTK